MATIQTAIRLTDGMTPAFRSMHIAMTNIIDSFETMQVASSNAVDVNRIFAARQELTKAEATFNRVEHEIREADQAQQQLNARVRGGEDAASDFYDKMKKVAGAIAAYVGVTKTIALADELTRTKARLNLMNDGLQTTAELQNMIFASAQRTRSSYIDTAQAVAKLGILAGGAFASNDELLMFAEQMNKQFRIGGASAMEQSSAMYQLTQAMAAGRLQGDEFRSIMENAPMLAQAIASTAGKTIGELRVMSSEGLLTAELIKKAMFAAAAETDAKFARLPVTWGEVWTYIANQAVQSFDPVLDKVGRLTQDAEFTQTVNAIVGGLAFMAGAAAWAFGVTTEVFSFIVDNWPIIGPIVWGIAVATAAYTGALLANSIAQSIVTARHTAQAIALAVQTKTTVATAAAAKGLTVAQWALNSALLASPLTWMAAKAIALVAVFYLAIGAVNRFAGTSISATGVIFGAFSTLGAFLWNLFLGFLELAFGVINAMVNPFIRFANFLGHVFTNPISSIIYLFHSMADNVLATLQRIATAMDFVFRTNMAATVADWRSGLRGMADAAVARHAPNESYKRIMDEMNLSVEGTGLRRWAYSDAWNVGYKAGQNLFAGFGADTVMDDIRRWSALTAENTAAMKEAMDITTEELKYMRDLAEREVINRFTTAEISVSLGGVTNNVNSAMDLDGVVSYLETELHRAMETAAEGVHG